jgi:uncharacterized UPF0160 family protein
MKKTLTRFQAQKMLEQLAGMALGYLPSEELEAVMDNFDVLKAETEKLEKMKAELAKRIYQGVDEKRLQDFFEAAQKNDNEAIQKDYADLLPLRNKEIEVIVSLYNKAVEMDIKELDGKEFRKAVLKAQPNTKQAVFEILAPLFKADEKPQDDFSELDELLK